MKKFLTLLVVAVLASACASLTPRLVSYEVTSSGEGRYARVIAKQNFKSAVELKRFWVKNGLLDQKPVCDKEVVLSEHREKVVVKNPQTGTITKYPDAGNSFHGSLREDSWECSEEHRIRENAGEEYNRALDRALQPGVRE